MGFVIEEVAFIVSSSWRLAHPITLLETLAEIANINRPISVVAHALPMPLVIDKVTQVIHFVVYE